MVKELTSATWRDFLPGHKVVLYFVRPGDPECAELDAYFDTMVLPRYREANVAVRKVDADANPALAREFAVDEVPTLVVYVDGKPLNFEARGMVINRIVGFNGDVEAVLTGLVRDLAHSALDDFVVEGDPDEVSCSSCSACGTGGACEHAGECGHAAHDDPGDADADGDAA